MGKLRERKVGKLWKCGVCHKVWLDENLFNRHMDNGLHQRPVKSKNVNAPRRRPKGLNKNHQGET
jgi:hypothetical protein